MTFSIRDAVAADAAAACAVLRRSIVELCAVDHRRDAALLARWLANKTPETVAAWIANPEMALLLACTGDTVLAVGAVSTAGEILLNYVSPDAPFRGASKTMLRALEARARDCGNRRCRLTSTATAHAFYRAAGYERDGAPVEMFGMMGYPMMRDLA